VTYFFEKQVQKYCTTCEKNVIQDLARIIYEDMKKDAGTEPTPSRKENTEHEKEHILTPSEV
jgi:hypothetical protein